MITETAQGVIGSDFVRAIKNSFENLYGEKYSAQAKTALADLNKLEFPITKDEFWKYTRTGRITRLAPGFSENNPAVVPATVENLNDCVLVFQNGVLSNELSAALPDGVMLSKYRPGDEMPEKFNALAQPKHRVFETINTAFSPAVYELTLSANRAVEQVITLDFRNSGQGNIRQPRLLIHAKPGSKATVVQRFSADKGSGFTNALAEIFVEENAHLSLIKLQEEPEGHFHHSADYVRVAKGGNFEILTAPDGENWTRNNLAIKLAGESAFARLNGLYLLKGNSHLDNNTFVDHAVPHCDSSELYKGVLTDQSTAVFNGKVVVRPDAQKTNAFQQNNNLLLSENAQQYSKPELEIYADDVKCSHGSTTGQMDEEALFYLQSRAIGREEASRMLVAAFASEVIDQLEQESLREYLHHKYTL